MTKRQVLALGRRLYNLRPMDGTRPEALGMWRACVEAIRATSIPIGWRREFDLAADFRPEPRPEPRSEPRP